MPERGARPEVSSTTRRALRAIRAFTSPLRPDDYLELINPTWTTRELRGTIQEIRPETHDTATIVIAPAFPWTGHRSGQYLRLGVEINGIRHWRAYTITADPGHPRGLVSVTVKCVDAGLVSSYLVRRAQPGDRVYLGEVEGRFTLPDPPPAAALMISAGSGVTPIHALLREMDRGNALTDVVHVYCMRTSEDVIFEALLAELAERNPGYRLIFWPSSEKGHLGPQHLDEVCPDWRERAAFLSGPPEMLDAFLEHWTEAGLREQLSLERFQPHVGADVEPGKGGTIRFRVSDTDAECDGSTPILEAGENAGLTLQFGCRMGICHTCVGSLAEGQVRDLRTGELTDERGTMIRICVNCPEGHVEVDL